MNIVLKTTMKTDMQSTLTKFTQKKILALTFLINNFRKLKWHQEQAHKEDNQGTVHRLPQTVGGTSKQQA